MTSKSRKNNNSTVQTVPHVWGSQWLRQTQNSDPAIHSPINLPHELLYIPATVFGGHPMVLASSIPWSLHSHWAVSLSAASLGFSLGTPSLLFGPKLSFSPWHLWFENVATPSPVAFSGHLWCQTSAILCQSYHFLATKTSNMGDYYWNLSASLRCSFHNLWSLVITVDFSVLDSYCQLFQ